MGNKIIFTELNSKPIPLFPTKLWIFLNSYETVETQTPVPAIFDPIHGCVPLVHTPPLRRRSTEPTGVECRRTNSDFPYGRRTACHGVSSCTTATTSCVDCFEPCPSWPRRVRRSITRHRWLSPTVHRGLRDTRRGRPNHDTLDRVGGPRSPVAPRDCPPGLVCVYSDQRSQPQVHGDRPDGDHKVRSTSGAPVTGVKELPPGRRPIRKENLTYD